MLVSSHLKIFFNILLFTIFTLHASRMSLLMFSVHHIPSTGKADVIWRMFEGMLLPHYFNKIRTCCLLQSAVWSLSLIKRIGSQLWLVCYISSLLVEKDQTKFNQVCSQCLVYFCGLLWPSLYWNKDSSLVYDTLQHFHYIFTKSTTFYIQYKTNNFCV